MFGYGQHDKSLWSQLVKNVQNKKKYFRMSGGEQLRDYLHVKEVANYIVNISMIQKDIGVVNICSGNPISVKEIVKKWIYINKWNIEPKLFEFDYPTYEPMNFWGDKKKLKKILRIN